MNPTMNKNASLDKAMRFDGAGPHFSLAFARESP